MTGEVKVAAQSPQNPLGGSLLLGLFLCFVDELQITYHMTHLEPRSKEESGSGFGGVGVGNRPSQALQCGGVGSWLQSGAGLLSLHPSDQYLLGPLGAWEPLVPMTQVANPWLLSSA